MAKQQLWMNFNLSVSAVNKNVNQYWLLNLHFQVQEDCLEN